MNRSVSRRLCQFAGSVGISVAALLVASTALNSMPPPPPPLPAIEVVASGLGAPIGIAVSPSGAIVVSDRRAGTVTQLGINGQHVLLADGLQRPVGLAFDLDGRLLIVEEKAGRLLERHSSGSMTVRASGLAVPRWVAVSTDGSAYLSGDGPGGDDDDDDPGASGGMRVMNVSPAGAITIAAEGFIGLQGLALGSNGLALSMRRLSTETSGDWTRLALLPFSTPGTFGTPVRLLAENMSVPSAVAIDRLGAVYMTAAPSRGIDGDDRDNGDKDDEQDGVLLKRLITGELITLASGLAAPHGIAIEADGHVLIAEQKRGRVLRLRAPGGPLVNAPAFTNQSPATITGTAEPGSRVQVFRDDNYGTALGNATADATTGAFSLSAPLAANAETHLTFIATSAGGQGLTSTPIMRTIVHDDVLPTTTMLAPPADLHTNGVLAVTARGEDSGSGVARVSVTIDGQPNGETTNGDPTQPLIATFDLNTAALTEGPHGLIVTTRDRAGNESSSAQPFVADRTPPETQIVSGPGATTAATSVTFTVSASDAIATQLQFSWRLDDQAWSTFGVDTAITISGLAPGPHLFNVRARDLAGNEDLTPAIHAFNVGSLSIRIAEPAPGTLVSTSSIWIRGTIAGAGHGVGISVTLPLELRTQLGISAVPAAVENGIFAAKVAVTPDTTELTVIAIDEQGGTTTESVPITTQPPLAPLDNRLEVSPPAGLAPHAVSFTVGLTSAAPVALDFDGDGTTDYQGLNLRDQRFIYSQPGIYVASIQVTGSDGVIRTHRTSVEVYDRAALDTRIQATWNGFKTALRNGDVTGAVAFIHSARRGKWRAHFTQLTSDALINTDQVLTDLVLGEVGPGGAEYEMMREVDNLMYSFPVSFVIDSDGHWRLWQF